MIGPTPRFDADPDLERMTDEQLEQLTRSLDVKLNGKQEKNLVAYRERVRSEHQERRQLSLYERVTEVVGRALGRTPARMYDNKVAEAAELHAQMDERYSSFEEQLEQRRDELMSVTERHKETQNFFMAATARYERARGRVDRLEAELESLDADDMMSTRVYEKREQLNHANRELLSARKDADRGMSLYMAASQSDRHLSQLVDTMQDHAVLIHGQLTAFGARISTWKSLGVLRFGDRHGPSLKELYEDVAITNESMERFSDRYLGENGAVFDNTYAIDLGGNDDPLVSRWQKVRSE